MLLLWWCVLKTLHFGLKKLHNYNHSLFYREKEGVRVIPKVSIAMCTYNGERFIREQLDSIVSQSFYNFELVIVDDCSSDSTVSIIKEYMQKDERIKFFQNEKNLGFVKNF